jgi:hypothetical protein
MYFVFCRLFPFSPTHHGTVWVLLVISLPVFRIQIRVDPHYLEFLDPVRIYEGKNRQKRNVMFLSAGCSLLRAEDFSCSFGVLYGGLGDK